MKQPRDTAVYRLSLQLLVALFLCAAFVRTAVAAPIKVACIGEHTTHSDLYPTANREQQPPGMQEYPRILQDLMGSGYDVRNFGDCCASVISGYAKSETHPYLSGGNYKNSVAFAPDIVVIGSWGRHDWGLSAMTALAAFTIEKFQADYETLVKAYLALPNPPKIYCSLPIPILAGQDGPDDGYKTSPAADAIKVVAAKYNLPTIDLFSAFLGHPELYRAKPMSDSEGEHVNDAGMQKLAELVHAALTGDTSDAGVPSGGASAGGGSGLGGGADAGGTGGTDGVAAAGGGATTGGVATGTGGDPNAAAGGVVVTAGTSGSPVGTSGAPSAGTAGTPTATATGGGTTDSATPASDGNGCSCSVPSRGDRKLPWMSIALMGAVCVQWVRRRNRTRSQRAAG
jgi:hypothetical protein